PAAVIAELNQVPPPRPWVRRLPWLVVAVILLGFAIGFYRSPELGWQLVADWVLINGGLAALGALLAGGHPLTVAGTFAAAPLTSLNPTVGVGMVAAAIEIFMRKPTVGDFSRLRRETTHLKGWWRNRVARTFLIFLLSSVGSAAGTYVAGFRIFERLAGA
nr:conjugal transfer protein TraB [Pseudomonadota bacterium]